MPRDACDLLLPTPRSVRRATGVVPEGALHRVTIEQDQSLPPDAYRLTLQRGGAAIAASTPGGERFACATLQQFERAGRVARVPECVIEDFPALARRGVMLDVSRCRVPRSDELHNQLDMFGGLKLDHLQLYTEHTFAYAGHERAWRGHSPITPGELRRLDNAAHAVGIDLAANQNCFGHLASWLRLPEYAHLAETHGDWRFAGMPRSGPFSLCPVDPASLDLIRDLLGQLLPRLRSPLVNIGCDETYDVGAGRSADAVARFGKAAVYADFVERVCEVVHDHARTPMLWADAWSDATPDDLIALHRIPLYAIALVWGYEPSTDFAAESLPHTEAGRAWWACPGTSSWRSLTGRTTERQNNIRRAAREGVAHGASGLLACDWGDVGHRQVWPISLMGIAEAADAAWTGADRGQHFLDAVSLQVFGDPSGTTARWLDALGDADDPLRAVSGPSPADGSTARLANATALFTELHHPPVKLALPEDPRPWREALDRLSDLGARVPTGAGRLVEDELRHAVDCATFAARVAIHRRTDRGESAQLEHDRAALVHEHRRLWKIRSRPGGLDESAAYWDNIDVDAAAQ